MGDGLLERIDAATNGQPCQLGEHTLSSVEDFDEWVYTLTCDGCDEVLGVRRFARHSSRDESDAIRYFVATTLGDHAQSSLRALLVEARNRIAQLESALRELEVASASQNATWLAATQAAEAERDEADAAFREFIGDIQHGDIEP